MPKPLSTFIIPFEDTRFSPAVFVPPDVDAASVVAAFGLLTPRPALFLSGGAGNMSVQDMAQVHDLIANGIAPFAEEHKITVFDGGTEAGIMQMMGDVRRQRGYKFPLIGLCPYHLVRFPGWENPAAEATLESGHSHFVLVDSGEWGSESHLIGEMTRAVSARQTKMAGILINGGAIAEKDVYFAVAVGENRIPLLVVDGSGRKADEIADAHRTGRTDKHIIRAIIQGGTVRVTGLGDGVAGLLHELGRLFAEV